MSSDVQKSQSHDEDLEPGMSAEMAVGNIDGSTYTAVPTEDTPLLGHENDSKDAAPDYSQDIPYKDIDGEHFRPLFACILLAYILCTFDSTLMASSHPSITSYFHSSNAASWLSTVFYLSSTVSLPVFGRISDTLGRRPVYLFSMALFGVTTAWCGLAQSMGSFIAARAACGLGAGGVLALSNILLSDVIKIEYRGIYQSYLNMAYSLGNGLGAAGGGLLCDYLGWRAAFGIQIPPILAFMVLAYFSIPSGLGPDIAASEGKGSWNAFKSFDTLGAFTITVTVSALILGINLGGNEFPWTHPIVISSLIVFGLSAVALIWIETRAARPVLPIPLLSSIPLGNLMWSNFFGSIVTNTVLFNFPLLQQSVRQVSPTVAGLYLLSPLIGVSISSVFTGYFIKTTRRLKPMMVIGVLFMLIGPILVSCLTLPGIPHWSIILLNPWTSIAQGFHFPATTVAVLALSSTEEQAVVTTTLSLMRNLGSILGVALSSWILQNVLPFYLERKISAAEPIKRQIIESVRKSVRSIGQLHEPYKAEGKSFSAQIHSTADNHTQ